MVRRWRLVLAGFVGLLVLTVMLWLSDLMGASKGLINGFFWSCRSLAMPSLACFVAPRRPMNTMWRVAELAPLSMAWRPPPTGYRQPPSLD